MSTREMHVSGSQDEQDPSTSTDILRITLSTALKSRLVTRDDHNGKILKYMTGHGIPTEAKNRRRSSESHGCVTEKGNLGGISKKARPCWCHSGTPSILPGWSDRPCLPGLSPYTHSASSNPLAHLVTAVPLLTIGLLLVIWPYNYSLP